MVAEMDSTGTITTSYGFKPDSTWGTDPLYIKQGGQFGYYHNDHLGTPQRIVSSSGQVLWSASYDAFGEATIFEQAISSNLRFPGQYFDEETGLHYNFYRYYDPETGRYIKSDPIGLKGGINNYIYALGSPLNNIDVFGLRISGKLHDSRVQLPIEFDVVDWGLETGIAPDLDKKGLPDIGVRVAWFDLKIGGTVNFLIYCKETDDCGNLVREGYVETSVHVPKIIPYHHRAVIAPHWVLRGPYKLVKLADKLNPIITNLAKANGIPVPIVCKRNQDWMDEIPFRWSDEIPLSP